jgi:hypothetical protein
MIACICAQTHVDITRWKGKISKTSEYTTTGYTNAMMVIRGERKFHMHSLYLGRLNASGCAE